MSKQIDGIEDEISGVLQEWGFKCSVDEGKLMLLELIAKAGAGFYNSHTEDGFLRDMRVLNRDRTANLKGRKFVVSMVYSSSADW